MELRTAHIILMASAIGLAVIYALWSANEFSSSGETPSAVMAGVSLAVAAALVVYLRRFVARGKAPASGRDQEDTST